MALRSRHSGDPVPGEVHRVTSAQEALSEEQRRRTRRYLISMSIRTACFGAVIFASGWLQWAFVIGAVFLPYLAVIAANAGRENDDFTNEPVAPQSRTELPAHGTRIITVEDSSSDRDDAGREGAGT